MLWLVLFTLAAPPLFADTCKLGGALQMIDTPAWAFRSKQVAPEILQLLNQAVTEKRITEDLAIDVAYDFSKRQLTGTEDPLFLKTFRNQLTNEPHRLGTSIDAMLDRWVRRRRVGLNEYEPSARDRQEIFAAARRGDALSSDPQMRARQRLAILGDLDDPPDCVRNATSYIAFDKNLTPAQKAALWEELASVLHTYVGKAWTFHRREGTHGAILFQGSQKYVVVIKADGRIFRGKLSILQENQKWDEDRALQPGEHLSHFDPENFDPH